MQIKITSILILICFTISDKSISYLLFILKVVKVKKLVLISF